MMSVVALSKLFLVHRKLLHTRPVRCGGCHCQWRMLLFRGQHSWHLILESKHTTTMSYPKYVQLNHRYIPNIPVHYHDIPKISSSSFTFWPWPISQVLELHLYSLAVCGGDKDWPQNQLNHGFLRVSNIRNHGINILYPSVPHLGLVVDS